MPQLKTWQWVALAVVGFYVYNRFIRNISVVDPRYAYGSQTTGPGSVSILTALGNVQAAAGIDTSAGAQVAAMRAAGNTTGLTVAAGYNAGSSLSSLPPAPVPPAQYAGGPFMGGSSAPTAGGGLYAGLAAAAASNEAAIAASASTGPAVETRRGAGHF